MECNIGEKDRKLRMTVGITAGVCALMFAKGRWRLPLALIALGGIASASTGVCLLNSALGINTCEADKKGHGADKGGGNASHDHHPTHKKQAARM